MTTVTSWDRSLEENDICCTAGEVEVRDLARGLAGALFVSLPLLFTMEMWQIARTIPEAVLMVLIGIGLIANRLFIEFAGYRKENWQTSKWWDTFVAFGIGIFASTVTLLATGLISPDMDLYLALKVIALEAIPTSMGASVAINQLGGGDAGDDGLKMSPDVKMVVGTILGSWLFAFNVAPTMETKVIAFQQNWWLVGVTCVLSLLVSHMLVAVSQFETRDLSKRRVITSEWLEALVAYILAFLTSMMMLWFFGYGTPMDPIEVWLPQTIALAYATTLGGAAGRLIL